MMFPSVARQPDGTARVEGLFPLHVEALVEVPELLESPEGDVKRRLFPEPSDDAKQKEDWERLVRPELFALLASAKEIVARDLKSLAPAAPLGPVRRWNLTVPAQHMNAWISALNGARLALGARYGVATEQDLRPNLVEKDGKIEMDERTFAIVKINVLAELQALLILDGLPESERPPRMEEEGPGEEGP